VSSITFSFIFFSFSIFSHSSHFSLPFFSHSFHTNHKIQRHSQIQSIFTYISQSHTSHKHIHLAFYISKSHPKTTKISQIRTRTNNKSQENLQVRPVATSAHKPTRAPLRRHYKKRGRDDMEVNLAN
jgi:hypothetical protein